MTDPNEDAHRKEFYSLAGLEKAKAEFEQIKKRSDNYDGNNPNKYQAQLRQAMSTIRLIESQLKSTGELPLTPEEALTKELDRAFPDAKHKTEVDHNGKRYRSVWWVEVESPKTWAHYWEEIKPQ